jgi:ABC-type nitrate/sulfonate/bicarbonate transport system permease component
MELKLGRFRFRLARLLGFALILILWVTFAPIWGAIRLPSPVQVIKLAPEILFESKVIAAQGGGTGGLAPHILATIQRTFIGAATGILLGVVAGLLMGWSERIKDLLLPPLEALRLTPSLVTVPFLVLWFGISQWSQIGVIIFYTFVMLQVNTLNAVRNVNPVYRQFAMTLGATRWQAFRTVVLPAIVPELTGGLRVIIALAWGQEVTAEIIGAQVGVGRVLRSMGAIFRTDMVLASLIWLTLIAVLVDQILVRVLYRTSRWKPREEK